MCVSTDMRFVGTKIAGVFLIEPEPHEDERGSFARIYCREEMRTHELVDGVEQTSLSYNRCRGTLRGMHYQIAPHAESKLVSCVEGRIFDVCVDLRPDSSTRGEWVGVELSARNRQMLYVPAGLAHGFQTLDDHSTVLYQISAAFQPQAARGIRWNDPRVGVAWPLEEPLIISAKDRGWPDWDPAAWEHP
jgi:dTDP-4-dehydrorhamnose 3,5-epimerase